MTKKIYHVSTTPNLKELKPHVSTHGKPYVYGTTAVDFAMFFGSNNKHGDFDGIYGIDENGTPFFEEAYEGALKERFDGQTCYIYELDPTTFEEGKTSFEGEVVSEKPVKVIGCTKVDNVYDYLQEANKEGRVNLTEFKQDDPEYTAKIDAHIEERIERFNIRHGGLSRKPARDFCNKKFGHIMNKPRNQENTQDLGRSKTFF
ncbi:MAG: hypothetical protein E7376_04995 [Clostridiales bacterium]|nr:hypothetical protein [Clostridiales bacterium]